MQETSSINHKLISNTIIECVVILVCFGLQLFFLRRFLLQKKIVL